MDDQQHDALEISIYRRPDETEYSVDLRFDSAGSDADLRVRGEVNAEDFQILGELGLQPEQYGLALRNALFSAPALRREVERAMATSERENHHLRVRIVTPTADRVLSSIRWELMPLPGRTRPLGIDERVAVSRYVDSQDLRKVTLRSRGQVRAAAVIAGTGDQRFRSGDRDLAPIDVEQETRLATSALEPFDVTVLSKPGEATLHRIEEAILQGNDVVYLVCHGTMGDDGPLLLLHEGFRSTFVHGARLVEAVASLQRPPRLVVLASCQSAGGGTSLDHGALAALGPELAAAGVPAVVAMQGNVTQSMVASFMPEFFRELARHGRIDEAMATARRKAHAEGRNQDWWAPVLFLRSRSGRLWYTGRGGERDGDFSKWPALISSIKDGHRVVVCGMGLTDSMIGSRDEVARSWAKAFGYPLTGGGRYDLARIAQYVSITQDEEFIRSRLRVQLMDEVKRRFGKQVTGLEKFTMLDSMLREVWRKARSDRRGDPHAVLANLPFSFYFNANPSSLLVEALRAVGRKPETLVFKWKEDLFSVDDPALVDAASFEPRWEDDYQPSPERPLVLYMFGSLQIPESLILTEDDYFDYLIGLTRNLDSLPPSALRVLARDSLLFLGFGVQDWDFRILSRTIQTFEGAQRKRSRRNNVAAQLAPDELDARDLDAARDYVIRYLNESDINVFWGSVDDFCYRLESEWRISEVEEP